MSHNSSVLDKIQAIEQRLDKLEIVVANYKREILGLVEELIKNAEQAINEKLEEERKRLMVEARKKAEAESEKIKLEYSLRIEQLKKKLEEKRDKVVEDVVTILLGL